MLLDSQARPPGSPEAKPMADRSAIVRHERAGRSGKEQRGEEAEIGGQRSEVSHRRAKAAMATERGRRSEDRGEKRYKASPSEIRPPASPEGGVDGGQAPTS